MYRIASKNRGYCMDKLLSKAIHITEKRIRQAAQEEKYIIVVNCKIFDLKLDAKTTMILYNKLSALLTNRGFRCSIENDDLCIKWSKNRGYYGY